MKDYYNDGSSIYALQNQFTAFVQTAVQRTRYRYINTIIKIQNTEILDILDGSFSEKGASLGNLRDSVFFYEQSNFADFWEACDRDISVAELLRQLSNQEQFILKLHVFDDASFRVIATVLQKSENTVKSIYYTAIKKLAMLLGGADEWIF